VHLNNQSSYQRCQEKLPSNSEWNMTEMLYSWMITEKSTLMSLDSQDWATRMPETDNSISKTGDEFATGYFIESNLKFIISL